MVFYELDMEKHVNLYESANERKNKHIQPTYNNNNNILKKKEKSKWRERTTTQRVNGVHDLFRI